MGAQRKRTVAVVQARMGSTRLPGKVLQDLGGRPLLALVLERVGRIAGVDEIAVATSTLAGDDPVAEEARRLGVRVVRGSEQDVLDRYATAAAELEADLVVRITADCPLVDPAVIGQLLAFRAAEELDYAAVLTGAVPAEGRRRFPDGLDAEVLRASVLAEAAREATAAYDREHVTPFIKARPERFRIGYLEAEQDLGDERWTVDQAEDLAFVRAVVARLDDPVRRLPDILAVLAAEPSCARSTPRCRGRTRVEPGRRTENEVGHRVVEAVTRSRGCCTRASPGNCEASGPPTRTVDDGRARGIGAARAGGRPERMAPGTSSPLTSCFSRSGGAAGELVVGSCSERARSSSFSRR